MKKIVLIALMALPFFATAQLGTPCQTQFPPETGAQLDAWAQEYYSTANQAARRLSPLVTQKDVPMAVHLVANTDGTKQLLASNMLNMLCQVNNDYDTLAIKYWLHTLDLTLCKNDTWNDPPTGNTAYQSTMPLGARKVSNVINSYLHGGGGNTGLCGVAPGASFTNGSPPNPGTVSCFGSCMGNSKTWSHELGHRLSLPHTFYGLEGGANMLCSTPSVVGPAGSENYARTGVDANWNTTGDRIGDTYPDYNPDRWSGTNCESCDVKDRKGVTFKIDETNIMGYGSDGCASLFTKGQKDKMHSFMTSISTSNSNALFNSAGVPIVAKPVEAAPAMPTLVYPAEAQEFAAATAVADLQWTASPGAWQYIVQISRKSSFTFSTLYPGTTTDDLEFVVNTNTLPAALFQSKLRNNFLYNWRVFAFNRTNFCLNWTPRGTFYTKLVSTSNAIAGLDGLELVPNPTAGDNVTMQLSLTEAMDVNVSMLNVAGQVVRSLPKTRLTEGEQTINLDVQNLANGIYFVQLLNERGIRTERLVISR